MISPSHSVEQKYQYLQSWTKKEEIFDVTTISSLLSETEDKSEFESALEAQLRRVANSEMEESEWEKFFQGNPAPSNLETSKQQLHKFCCQQSMDAR